MDQVIQMVVEGILRLLGGASIARVVEAYADVLESHAYMNTMGANALMGLVVFVGIVSILIVYDIVYR